MTYRPPDCSTCYITIDGREYDCSKWKDFHPGGKQVLDRYHLEDATDVFYAFHGKEAFAKLKNMKSVEKTFPLSPEAKAFREFRQKLVADGWFESSKLWYLYKTAEVCSLWILGMYLGAIGHYIIGGLLLGLAYQQQGWLSHDYCHQQVFENRRINNFFGYFLGGVGSGFSINWWKDRHNTHHAITNVMAADPDLDNLPLFVWDEKDFHRVSQVPGASSLIPYQHWYFLPWTVLLKIIWNLQSFLFIKSKHTPAWNKVQHYERLCIATHWAWLSLFCYFFLESKTAVFWFVLCSEFVGGAGIANIVFMNHYGCEHPAKLDTSFASLQLATTANIDPSMWMNWFSGGLNLQVEHHLFPTMPRHNLIKVRPLVQQWAKDNGLVYQSRPFGECMKIILGQLSKMSREYLKYSASL